VVRELLRAALAIYDLDLDLLTKLGPELVVTQDLCEVCTVSYGAVCAAVGHLAGREVAVVSLHPQRLDDIWGDVDRVAAALGRRADGQALLARLLGRLERVERRAAAAGSRPRVVSIEWLEPVMLGGTWMPELIAAAGGVSLGVAAGQRVPTLDLAALERLEPEVVVVKPCGYPVERTLAELELLPRALPWTTWPAVRSGRVFVADGNAYFNRSGPRIVDSAELLAACLHPRRFPAYLDRYREAVRRVDATSRSTTGRRELPAIAAIPAAGRDSDHNSPTAWASVACAQLPPALVAAFTAAWSPWAVRAASTWRPLTSTVGVWTTPRWEDWSVTWRIQLS
jgi:iron complex transport system substrate-binding protein